jgi:hypothetical protein
MESVNSSETRKVKDRIRWGHQRRSIGLVDYQVS